MRFHTDPHIDLALLEHRASGLCNDGLGDFLNTLFGVAPAAAADLGAVGGDLIPALTDAAPLIAEGVGTTIPGIIDNTLSSGLLDAINAYQGIDPSIIAGLASGAFGIDNSLAGISDLLSSTGAAGGGLTNLLKGTTGIGGTTGAGTTGISGGSAGAPSAPTVRAAGPSGLTGPSPFAGDTKIDNTLTPSSGPANLGGGSSAITAPSAPAAAAPVAAAAAAPAAPKDAGGGLGGISGFLKSNAPLLSLGALGASALMPKQNIPNLSKMNASADAASKAALDLISSVSTGKLPPGAEAGIQQALASTQAGIKSRYASMGLSGSTMEAQDLAAAGERAAAMKFDLANQLTQTGLNAAGLSDQIYAQIAQLVLGQDASLQDALAAFAQSMGLSAALQNKAA